MTKRTVEEEFQDPNDIGYQILFIAIAGALGDIFVHAAAEITKNWKYPFAKGLLPYYKSLEYGSYKNLSSILLGALWGSVACLVALLIAKLLAYFKELDDDKK
jgi:hypothetical protein